MLRSFGIVVPIRKTIMKLPVKKMCEASVLLALGILLPMFFHLFGAGGPVFLPMHLPVLLAGLLLGPFYGGLLGILIPLFSFLLTQMPQIGILPGTMVELVLYGLSSGFFFRVIKTGKLTLDLSLSLLFAMLLGRMGGGLTTLAIYANQSQPYSLAAWTATYFVVSWPGILIQWLLIPSLMFALIKSHLWSENERYLNPHKVEEANRKEQASFFDALAPKWSEVRILDQEKVKQLLSPLSLKGEVLDVACGDGVLDEELLSEGLQVDGIDISAEMIRNAKAKHPNPNLTYFCGDFYSFETQKRYDALIVFDAYPHFIDRDAFAEKASRLLKKGGRLFILQDAAKETINQAHTGMDKEKVSRQLLAPKQEALPYWKWFRKGQMRDGHDSYLLELIRR